MSSLSVGDRAIEREVGPNWRHNGYKQARFTWVPKSVPGSKWFLVEVWFEADQPNMQIRSGAKSIEEAEIILIAIGLAIDWVAEEIARVAEAKQ